MTIDRVLPAVDQGGTAADNPKGGISGMVNTRTATVVSHYATTNPHEKRISLAAEPWESAGGGSSYPVVDRSPAGSPADAGQGVSLRAVSTPLPGPVPQRSGRQHDAEAGRCSSVVEQRPPNPRVGGSIPPTVASIPADEVSA